MTRLKARAAANRLGCGWRQRKPPSTDSAVLLKDAALFVQEERGMSLSELLLKMKGRDEILALEEWTSQTKVCPVDFQTCPPERFSCCADDVVAGLESQMCWLVGMMWIGVSLIRAKCTLF